MAPSKETVAPLLAGRFVMGVGVGMAVPAIRRIVILGDPVNLGHNLGRLLAADVAGFAARPCAVVGSVAGFSVDDYADVTERLAARDEIDAIELNISCPNVAHEGETFACDPDLAARATRAAATTC